MADQRESSNLEQILPSKTVPLHQTESVKAEATSISQEILTYDGDEEPELHLQTWIAVGAMFMLNFVQVFALMGPPSVVSIYANHAVL